VERYGLSETGDNGKSYGKMGEEYLVGRPMWWLDQKLLIKAQAVADQFWELSSKDPRADPSVYLTASW